MQCARFHRSAEDDEGGQAAHPESGGERVKRVDGEVEEAGCGCMPGRGNGDRGAGHPSGRASCRAG